jgi:hypothetical protein
VNAGGYGHLDGGQSPLDNAEMSTEVDIGISPEMVADAEAAVEAVMTGKTLDPAVSRRIQERAAKIREKVFQKHGLLDIGVPAIRELRDR